MRGIRRLFGRRKEETPDPIVHLSGGDPAMQAAIDAARASLDAFLARVLPGDGRADENACLKVAVPAGRDVPFEHVWVGPFKREGDRFAGVLNADPAYFDHVKAGDVLPFDHAQITDWGYIDGEVHYGNYTTRVVIGTMPEAERAAYQGMFPPDPWPSGWG